MKKSSWHIFAAASSQGSTVSQESWQALSRLFDLVLFKSILAILSLTITARFSGFFFLSKMPLLFCCFFQGSGRQIQVYFWGLREMNGPKGCFLMSVRS